MSKTQIDGTVLLLAALAALLALSVCAGPFTWLGSIAGLILVFILLACDREGYRSGLESLAFSAVFGLCLTVASAVLWRYVAASQNRPASFEGVVANDWLPLFWLGLTLLFVPIDRARMSGRVQQPVYAPASPHAISGLIPRTPQPVPQAFTPQPAPQPFTPPPPPPTPVPVHVVTPAPPPAPPPPPVAPPGPPPSFTRPTFSQPITPEPQPVFTHVAPVPEPPPPPPPPLPRSPVPVVAPEPEFAPVAIPPVPPGREATIYVTLVDEGLNVLRAVRAENLGHDFYRIAEEMPPGETWQYGPNQVVRCKKKNLSSGKAMVAIEEAPRAH